MGVKPTPSQARLRSQGPQVRLRIGELVLHGFERRHAPAIRAAFERELTRHLEADRPVATVHHVDLGTVQVPASTPVRKVGARAAEAVAQRLAAPGGAKR